jgi:hypothetical protein
MRPKRKIVLEGRNFINKEAQEKEVLSAQTLQQKLC